MVSPPSRGSNRPGANPTPQQVARLRADAGLTQEQFGALVYKSWRTVQNWEAGERRMPPDTWELVRLKLELLRRGHISPQAVKDLGLQLPGEA